MKTKFYHVRVKQSCFTNDSELLMICTSKKEANEYKRLYEKCPRYEGMEIYVEIVD